MIKNFLISSFAISMMLLLLTACAEDDQSVATGKPAVAETSETEQAKPKARPAPKKPDPRPQEDFQSVAIMSEPVDFSSAEQVTATFDKIKTDAGDDAAIRVQNAIEFLLVYDLGVGRNKEKLYQKLNGKTPNEIIAMTGR